MTWTDGGRRLEERLYAAARPALDELRAAVATVGELGEVINLDMFAVALTGNLRLVVVGAPSYGLSLASEDRVRDDLARGELVTVLEEFSTSFRGPTCMTRSGGISRRRSRPSSSTCAGTPAARRAEAEDRPCNVDGWCGAEMCLSSHARGARVAVA
jgi:hypothetical protein